MAATDADIRRWRRQGRHDILQYAEVYGEKARKTGFVPFADLWISPRTGNDLERCPFVRKVRGQDRYTCTIYETRPQACRDYPSHVSHMQYVNCEMLEDGDTDEDVARFMHPSAGA